MIKNTHGWAEGIALKRKKKKLTDTDNSIVIVGVEGEGGGYGGAVNGGGRTPHLGW